MSAQSKTLLFSVTIRDCDVQTFSAGGKGGQHQNKTQTGVRVVHRPSGAVAEARDSRSQDQNKQAAFGRMARTKPFQRWLRLEAAKRCGERSLDEIVDEQMAPQNLRLEVRDESGKWTPDGHHGEPK